METKYILEQAKKDITRFWKDKRYTFVLPKEITYWIHPVTYEAGTKFYLTPEQLAKFLRDNFNQLYE